MNKKILKLPLLGIISQSKDMYKISKVMGISLSSGFSREDSMKMAHNQISNSYLKLKFAGVKNMVEKGNKLSESFRFNRFDDVLSIILNRVETTGNEKAMEFLESSSNTFFTRINSNVDKLIDRSKSVVTLLNIVFVAPILFMGLAPQIDLVLISLKSVG